MNIQDYFHEVASAKNFLAGRTKVRPKTIVVLSGGMSSFVDAMTDTTVVAASEIPHFPTARAQGHAGKLVFGHYNGQPLVALQGRYHFYEGHDPASVVFPYFVLNALGATHLLTTNAVGGIGMQLDAGDIMMTTDHINMMGHNPLIGITVQHPENQFPSMQNAYDKDLRALAHSVAQELTIPLKEGVYCGVSGPNYETPAEIRMFRQLGADTVGMSTVFEVIAAAYLNMKVLTLNCISNVAADRHTGTMTHAEVLEAMKQMEPNVVKILQGVLKKLS